MTSGDSNFSSRGGPGGFGASSMAGVPRAFVGVPEESLLAWIEGELSPSEASDLVAKYPEAVALVSALRRDRATLAAAAVAKAPADLAYHVLAAIEREALMGVSDGELVHESLPISQVPKRRVPGHPFGRGAWQNATPKLALAAGVAIIASAGMIFVLRGGPAGLGSDVSNDGPKNGVAAVDGPIGPLAVRDPSGAAGLAEGESGVDADPKIASKSSGDSPGESGLAMAMTGSTTGATTGAAIGAGEDGSGVARSAQVASAAGTLDPERALALAGEGRLVLRVRGALAANAAKITHSRERGLGGAWSVQAELPPLTLASLTPPVASGVHDSRGPEGYNPIVASMRGVAADFAMGPVSLRPQPEMPGVALSSSPELLGSVIDLRADVATLELARAQLSKLLGRTVEFEESPHHLVIESPAPTPESVLWWTRPPREWVERVRVPLVVELK